MSKLIIYLIRIIALPFFSAIGLIAAIRSWIQFTIDFLFRGGEAISYRKNLTPDTIADIMNLLNEKLPKPE